MIKREFESDVGGKRQLSSIITQDLFFLEISKYLFNHDFKRFLKKIKSGEICHISFLALHYYPKRIYHPQSQKKRSVKTCFLIPQMIAPPVFLRFLYQEHHLIMGICPPWEGKVELQVKYSSVEPIYA